MLLCRFLDRSVVEPVVVMPNEGVVGGRLRDMGVELILAPRLRERTWELRYARDTPLTRAASYARNLWDSLVFTFQLAALARGERCDLVYGNHMMVKIMSVVAGVLSGRPVILHTRTIYANAVERALYGAFAALPHVKRIVAVSRASAANFPRAAHKVRIVHNGVPLDELPGPEAAGLVHAELGLDPSAPVVGFVGRLVAWKGVDAFLEAAALLAPSFPEAHFVVVGDAPTGSTHGTLDDFRRHAAARGLGGRVTFLGFRKDAVALVRGFTVLAVPSVSPDPCPRVVLEALAVGTPVVGSASGGIAETVEDGVSGFLVRPGDGVDLAANVGRILADPELGERLGRGGMAAARRDFDARTVAERVQGIIVEALGAGGR
jgi:glycosyltransferase involved in cell wall biosynthesis